MRYIRSAIMSDNNDVFCMLATEDKLDGTNYPLWAYMMRHVLVAKGVWNVVAGNDVRPLSRTDNATSAGTVEDEAGTSTMVEPPPSQEQRRWDGRDAQAHALIAL